MKKKIIGILVCMLLIATAVPAVTSVKNSTINAIVPSHPLPSMAGSWTETQKLLAADGVAGDQFGSLSLDGDTALIGAWGHDDNGADSGAAYVFIRTGATWTLQQKLLASDGQADDSFGSCVSLEGDTALVGAGWDDDNGVDSGSAYVFTRTGTIWTQQAKLLPADGAVGDLFGGAVSLSGDTALIGADQDNDNGNWSGSAYVFTRTGTTWTQQAKLLAPDGATEDLFGWWISLDSNTALIAAKWDDDNGDKSGSAYVFTRTGTTWTLQQKLIGSDTAAGDRFGVDVCLDGDTAIIGACYDDDMGTDSGSAYVFTRTGTTWTQQAKLLASDGAADDSFCGDTGCTSIDGDTAIIGAWYNDDKGTNSGSAYVFTRTGSTWTQQQKLLSSDGAAGDSFGGATALDGDTALICSWFDDDMGINSGSVYAFTKVVLTVGITGGFGVNLKITNNGLINATDVAWQIHVEGGILGRINKTVNGTVDIPAGETVTVKTGMLFGFGAISITAKVADEEQTATGTQIIIFSMVK